MESSKQTTTTTGRGRTKPNVQRHGHKWQEHRITVQLICAVLLIIVGCALLISGFIVPPMGQIHNSVLIGFGELLTFVGALFGIDYKYKWRIYTHLAGGRKES